MYSKLDKRVDAIVELLDAICSNPNARSVVELSLDPYFHRTHDSIYKAIGKFSIEELAELVTQFIPEEKQRHWIPLVVDVTYAPREYAYTLEDRGFVYKPTVIQGNKPITIGHQYSTIVYHPEPEEKQSPHWVAPLSVQRVRTEEKKPNVAVKQIQSIMESSRFRESDELIAIAGDSDYSGVEYLYENQQYDNLVCVSRVRSDRTFHLPHIASDEELLEKKGKGGRRKQYGKKFKLPDSTTWHAPSEEVRFEETNKKGETYIVQMERWDGMIMKGKNKPKRMAMYKHPFSLIRITSIDPETGEPKYANAIWLLVMGKRRNEFSLQDIYDCYGERYDIEHFFRFSKQKLLLDSYQTPQVEYEENWWKLVHLAYLQLWLVRQEVQPIPRPWEDHLETSRKQIVTPATAQRAFPAIKCTFENNPSLPKPRGNSSGSQMGTKRTPRIRHPVVKKEGKKTDTS